MFKWFSISLFHINMIFLKYIKLSKMLQLKTIEVYYLTSCFCLFKLIKESYNIISLTSFKIITLLKRVQGKKLLPSFETVFFSYLITPIKHLFVRFFLKFFSIPQEINEMSLTPRSKFTFALI